MLQACDGLALATSFVHAKISIFKYVAFVTIFVLITPTGIAAGVGISTTYTTGSRACLASQGTFSAFAAGESLFGVPIACFSNCMLSSRHVIVCVLLA